MQRTSNYDRYSHFLRHPSGDLCRFCADDDPNINTENFTFVYSAEVKLKCSLCGETNETGDHE